MDRIWVNPRLVAFILGEDDCDDTEELISGEPVEGWLEYELAEGQELKEKIIV